MNDIRLSQAERLANGSLCTGQYLCRIGLTVLSGIGRSSNCLAPTFLLSNTPLCLRQRIAQGPARFSTMDIM